MRFTADEKHELDEIVLEAFGNGGSSREKGARYERLLLDAEQAHRSFASRLLDEARHQALIADGRRRYQSLTAVPVSYKGEILSMPKALSRKVRNSNGDVVRELRLLEYHSWEDVVAKAQEIGRTITGYQATLAGLLRLLELREMFPESEGPGDACVLAGTTIEAVVSGEVAA